MRADARRNRERILAAARRVFAEEGVGAQMEPIAKRAGVGVGTLYRNFPTKNALIEEMVREWSAERSANLDAAAAIADPWAGLGELVRRSAEAMSRDAGLREVFGDLPAKRRAATDDEVAFRDTLAALLGRAHDAGELRRDVTAGTFIALMTGLSATIDAGVDWRQASGILLAGVRATTPALSDAAAEPAIT